MTVPPRPFPMRSLCLLVLLGAVLPLAAQEAAVPAPVPAAPADQTAPASVSDAPAADEPVAKAVKVPAPRRHFDLPQPANPADVQDYIGHRYYEDTIDSGGWGWIKRPTDTWSHGRWVTLRETPSLAPAPYRALGGGRTADQNYEYKLRGYFAPYQAYDPHTDEMLDVFVLLSCEPIGPAEPLSIRTGPDTRKSHLRSTFSSRNMGE